MQSCWKGAKFAGSVGHPMTKMLSASAGLRPPDQGLCPWTPLGLCPHYRLVLSSRHGAPPMILAPRAPQLFWPVYAYAYTARWQTILERRWRSVWAHHRQETFIRTSWTNDDTTQTRNSSKLTSSCSWQVIMWTLSHIISFSLHWHSTDICMHMQRPTELLHIQVSLNYYYYYTRF